MQTRLSFPPEATIPYLKDNQEISIASNLEQVSNAEQTLRKFIERNRLPDDDIFYIILSFNEAIINIIQHAYKSSQGIIDIEFLLYRNKLIIRIRDYGLKLDPSKFRGRKLDELKPSGLGIYLMRSFMDEVTYLTGHANGTELYLLKHLPIVD